MVLGVILAPLVFECGGGVLGCGSDGVKLNEVVLE